MAKENGHHIDVAMLDPSTSGQRSNGRTTDMTKRMAWAVALAFAVCCLIVVGSYFGGTQINWYVINLNDQLQQPSTMMAPSSTGVPEKSGNFRLMATEDTISKTYKSKADDIMKYLTSGKGQGQAYDRLAYIADTFGHRMVGSKALEDTIDYLVQTMTAEGLDNVHKEEAPGMPLWIRGEESATLLAPKEQTLKILGLGFTVPTPQGGICADAVVVRSYDELDRIKDKVAGKIVVYYQPWVSYGVTVDYRENGASAASKYGAVAVLVRSATNHSVYSPHTGYQGYADGVKPIPAACLTVEDAAMLYRMQTRGDRLKICVRMTSRPAGTTLSHNTVAEIRGSSLPDEVVLISGHLDSWDVGTGAMDDGGGVIIAWQALSAMKALGLRPRRTVRAVFWTAEEQGHVGSAYYYRYHKEHVTNETYRFVYESDAGAFKPKGLNFSGTDEARKIMTKIMTLLKPIGAQGLFPLADGGDVDYWMKDGVPAGQLEVEDKQDYYFTYHHTQADNVIIFEPQDLDYAAAMTAVVAFVVADLDQPLPTGHPGL